jgi:hypothetical protein
MSFYARADQSITTIPTALYELKFDITDADPTGKVYVGSAQGGNDLLNESITAVQSYMFQFTAIGFASWIRFEETSASGEMKVDNVSCKALTGGIYEGGGLNQLLNGIAENHTGVWDALKTMAHIRDPRSTPILDDLEREFGVYPNPALTDQVRRDKLAAIKYARVGTGSKDNLQNALHTAGFTNLFVWENSPAQDPSIFFGGALIYCTPSNPLYVAVAGTGPTGRAMTSSDGISWTLRSSPLLNWRDVAYGNGIYVAVADPGTSRVMTSPDGVTWTQRTPSADLAWYGVTFAENLFVAVAASGTNIRVMTSPDGITWTQQTTPSPDRDWRSITWGNGLFVAVATSGTGNRVITSPDGITWTNRSSAADLAWRSVTHGNGIFVAVADSGTSRVMTSPDGITWTQRTPSADLGWRAVCFGAGLFVAVSNSGTGNRVMTSPDGINWTSRSSAADNNWNGVTWFDDNFVAVATSGTGNRVQTSPDGITWTSRSSAADEFWWSVTGGLTYPSIAQCGEPGAQCGWFQGELIVNGDIFDFTVDYVATCGETLAQCDEPTAVAGNFSGTTRTKIDYPLPTDPIDWPFIFFVGGDATYNPDTGASIYCGDTLAQCDEPIAFCQWFCGALQDIEFVDLPYSRRADLVRLILQIKPIHSWCALLVNFT